MLEEPREPTYDLTGLSLDEIDCIAGALEYRLRRIESGAWREDAVAQANRHGIRHLAFVESLPRQEDHTAGLSRGLVERLVEIRGGRPGGLRAP